MDLAQILLKLIGFTGDNLVPTVINENGEYAPGKQLIISLSMSGQIDSVLNTIKSKAFACFNMLIETIQLQATTTHE